MHSTDAAMRPLGARTPHSRHGAPGLRQPPDLRPEGAGAHGRQQCHTPERHRPAAGHDGMTVVKRY